MMIKKTGKRKKVDHYCKNPLCIRELKELPNGYWQFEIHWTTSTGTIRSRGWLWKPTLNRLDGPKCKGYPIIDLPDFSRAAVRTLFTQVMLRYHLIVVPPIKHDPVAKKERFKANEKEKQRKQLRDSYQADKKSEGSRINNLAETHPEWGDLS